MIRKTLINSVLFFTLILVSPQAIFASTPFTKSLQNPISITAFQPYTNILQSDILYNGSNYDGLFSAK
ncbi:MAG: hypothetical protein ACMG6E_07170, partial [Candidatus Roizmanbacteria bacterium]